MKTYKNQNPEQIARDKIDSMLTASGWDLQSNKKINLSAKRGVAVREYQTDIGPADYVLFVDHKPVGIIEAKREEEGHRLTVVQEQSTAYSKAKLKYLNNSPLPFVYESTGTVTQFTDYSDPKPRGRIIFSFHKPETLAEYLKSDKSLRNRILGMPSLDPTGLRPAQVVAIENLEESFKHNRPKALIQMATGAGKTYTAATFIYRLLKHADAKRILFLVDTRNLGEQAEQEFMKFRPSDDNRKFTELYNVQRLSSSYIATDSQVCISTIQRLYSILKGEELDESSELDNPNESSWMEKQLSKNEPVPVVYNEKVPIEQFDFIVIDECHRSIYNLWQQVLEYFDAFLIGLTATPDNRTFGFFNENVVSEYTYEESVSDGVNVPYDVYTIETEITKNGAELRAKEYVDKREKLSRKKRREQMDEDYTYSANKLDKDVVNPSQIRNIIKAYKSALITEIYPKRFNNNGDYEVPKTLVFAKSDSHADDIIQIIREEFDEGNDFCKKVTYKSKEDPKSVLNQFRNSYNPRIAVTVDMIATGTDVKPLEVLLFMRDVKSKNYFEQMKGRGTRTIDKDTLQSVSRTADAKTHFVIVDAVGAVKSKKTNSRPLERKKSVPLKDLLGAVTMGVQEEDLFLSLANRLIRLDKQLTEKEQNTVLDYSEGKNLKQITKSLLNAFDPDAIEEEARRIKVKENLTDIKEARKKAEDLLQTSAASIFNGDLNNYLDNVRKIHEQIIDGINIDNVTKSEWNRESVDRANEIIKDFSTYMEIHKDEITALSIFYNQPYNRRDITFKMIKEVLEKLKMDKPALAPDYIWDAYAQLDHSTSSGTEDSAGSVNIGDRPKTELVTLVSLIRRVTGLDSILTPYSKTVDKNFKAWIFKKHSGAGDKFSHEQMEWLRMIKDHITSSFHVEVDDLDYTPFDAQGGRGKMWKLFGDKMDNIIDELNETLAV
ncbi:MAG: DEAD/DEAH box helicase family protein [Spirochaetaceae bacterium]|nr:DEAD/DEAH box helicase family protein [Spirochaetaceae bacterium]